MSQQQPGDFTAEMNSIEDGIAALTKIHEVKKRELDDIEKQVAALKLRKEEMLRQARGDSGKFATSDRRVSGDKGLQDSNSQTQSIGGLEVFPVESGREAKTLLLLDPLDTNAAKSLRDAAASETSSRRLAPEEARPESQQEPQPSPNIADRRHHDQSYYKLTDSLRFSKNIFKLVEKEDQKDAYIVLSKSADEKLSQLSVWDSRDNRLEEMESFDMNIIDICCIARADGRTAIFLAAEDLSVYLLLLPAPTARNQQIEYLTLEKQALVHRLVLQSVVSEGRVFFEDERKTTIGFLSRSSDRFTYCQMDAYSKSPKKLDLEFEQYRTPQFIQQALLTTLSPGNQRLMLLTPNSVMEMSPMSLYARQIRSDYTLAGTNTCFAQLADRRLAVASTRCIDMEKNTSGTILGSYCVTVFSSTMLQLDSLELSTSCPFFEVVLHMKARLAHPGIEVLVAVSAVYSTYLMTKVAAHVDIFLFENQRLSRTACFDDRKTRATQSAVNSFLLESKKLTLAGNGGLLKVMMLV